ncbi:hypothetical protein [Vibrio variabilis]|uniref:hypothetical protein n=1 Tax=Vibrio variabilis TaxID=990271 RepID=UPI000DDA84A7|nr:hypothetical protein [Vibrio variabilis]
MQFFKRLVNVMTVIAIAGFGVLSYLEVQERYAFVNRYMTYTDSGMPFWSYAEVIQEVMPSLIPIGIGALVWVALLSYLFGAGFKIWHK